MVKLKQRNLWDIEFNWKETISVSNLCYLSAPVEQNFGTNFRLVFLDKVKKTAVWHQLRDDHHLSGHAERKDADAVLIVDRCHDTSLFQHLLTLAWRLSFSQHLDCHNKLHVVILWNPQALKNQAMFTYDND